MRQERSSRDWRWLVTLLVALLPAAAGAKDNCHCRSGANVVGHLCVPNAIECKQQCLFRFAAPEFGFTGEGCDKGFSMDLYEYCLDFCQWDRAKAPPRGEGGIEFWGSEQGGAWYMITCKCPDGKHYGLDTNDRCLRQWGARNEVRRGEFWCDWYCAADLRIPKEANGSCRAGYRPCIAGQSDKCCPVSEVKPTTPK